MDNHTNSSAHFTRRIKGLLLIVLGIIVAIPMSSAWGQQTPGVGGGILEWGTGGAGQENILSVGASSANTKFTVRATGSDVNGLSVIIPVGSSASYALRVANSSPTTLFNVSTAGNVGIAGNVNVTGALTIEGGISGFVNATNISSGQFGLNSGGGIFSFPASVGIGDDTPTNKLDVAGAIGISDITVIDASRNLVNIGTITSGLVNGQTISSVANFTGTVTASGLIYSTTNGFKFPDGTIQATAATTTVSLWSALGIDISNVGLGKVGIGDTTPTNKLDVAGAIGISDITVIDASRNLVNIGTITSDLINGQTISSVANFTGTVKAGGMIESTSGGFKFPDGTTQTTAVTGATSQWTTSGANIYYNTGNVGVGTSSPVYKLDVAGTLHAVGAVTLDSTLAVAGGISGIMNATNISAGQFGLNSGGGIFSFPASVGIGDDTPTNKLDITGAIGISDITVIDASRNLVNIGTITSGLVNGQTISSAANFTGTVTASGLIYSTTNGFKFPDGTIQTTAVVAASSSQWTTSGLNIYYNTGNVGVGTITPGVKLDISGGVGTALRILGGGDLEIAPQTSGSSAVLYNDIGVLNSTVGFRAGGTIESTSGGFKFPDGTTQTTAIGVSSQWTTSGSNIYYNTGNVGIGTTSPSAPLQIGLDSSSVPGILIGSGANTTNYLSFSGGRSMIGVNLASGNTSFSAGGAKGFDFYVNGTNGTFLSGTNALTINSSGNVGIGTTAPLTKLHILGGDTAPSGELGGLIVGGTTAAYRLVMGYNVTNNYGWIQSVQNGVASTPLVLNANGGNIGIGTVSPAYKLDVSGTLHTTGAATLDGTLTVGGGTGKINAGTIDPPYTINGEKFATYMPSMTGVKEETTGVLQTSCSGSDGKTCAQVIDFGKVAKGSDIWLFAKTTNLKKNFKNMAVLLTSGAGNGAWYEKDEQNFRLIIKSSIPGEVSYRLTAPRFDSNTWQNTRTDDNAGFIITE